ncbi:MAG: intradiol ring-cleavage dioxygenase [Burkholderiales bacterium]|nr:intradiol ring-cleavage dioxygenase [Burkholderiales bacterium]
MRNITEDNLTDAVLARFAGCADPRLQQVMGALVRHLHGFVREVGLTEGEWAQAIDFLTATGQACTGQRQEFILLSDTLGVSMLVTALNHQRPPGATEATVLGPFHVDGLPLSPQGADLAQGAPGEPLFAEIEIVGLDGTPVADAEVDIWQADEQGLYDVQRPELGDARQARGRLRSDAQGRLRFRSALPTAYPVPTDGPVGRMLQATGRHAWRPAHLHFRVSAPGFAPLVTHLFRDPDPYLDSDAVFGVRSSLIVRFERHDAGTAPDGCVMTAPFHTLRHRLVLAPAADLPVP